MRSGSKERMRSLRIRQKRGQMTVELAVCLPIVLALLGVVLNVLGYLNVCARFDRIAADAVRSQAVSPGYGQEGTALTASRVQKVIETSFQSSTGEGFLCEIAVTATPLGFGEGLYNDEGVSFSMLAQLERYDCKVTYHPWPFSQIMFLEFFELTHTRSYTINSFNPGVLF